MLYIKSSLNYKKKKTHTHQTSIVVKMYWCYEKLCTWCCSWTWGSSGGKWCTAGARDPHSRCPHTQGGMSLMWENRKWSVSTVMEYPQYSVTHNIIRVLTHILLTVLVIRLRLCQWAGLVTAERVRMHGGAIKYQRPLFQLAWNESQVSRCAMKLNPHL